MRPVTFKELIPPCSGRLQPFRVHSHQNARMVGIAGERVRAVEAAYNHVIAIVAGVLAGRGTLRPRQHVEEGKRILAARQRVRNLGHGFLQAKKSPRVGGLWGWIGRKCFYERLRL